MRATYFSEDTRAFLQLLYKHKVKYMIVGGEAVIYYGYPRLTGDVDFFIIILPKIRIECIRYYWSSGREIYPV